MKSLKRATNGMKKLKRAIKREWYSYTTGQRWALLGGVLFIILAARLITGVMTP